METNLGSHIRVSLGDLKDEVNQIRKTHSKLKDDAAFVLWFIEAWICDAGVDPAGSLTGESGDKNADAIYEDEKAHQVHIVQGKFRQSVDHSEKRNDVLSFVDLALFPWKSKDAQNQFYLDLPPLVKEKFEGLVKRVRIDKWSLKMHYVTTGRCSAGIIDEAQSRIKDAEGSVEFTFYDSKMVLTIMKDYLEGVAPGVPVLGLKIASVGPITTQGNIYRLDPRSKIESYVFTMAVEDVADLYAKVGIRLFARNIRGYLGSTEVNDAIADTAKHEPENFWYYNNGVTIVCDDIRKEDLVGNLLFMSRSLK